MHALLTFILVAAYRRTSKAIWILLVSVIVSATIIRSPIGLAIQMLGIVLYVAAITKVAVRSVVRGAILAVFVLLVAGALGYQFLNERLADILSGNDQSFYFRITGPVMTTIDLLQMSPYFGVGAIGNLEPYANVISGYFEAQYGNTVMGDMSVGAGVTNSLALLMIYYGAVGAPLFYFLFRKVLNTSGLRRLGWGSHFGMLALMCSGGGFVASNLWIFITAFVWSSEAVLLKDSPGNKEKVVPKVIPLWEWAQHAGG
jgi:hypothetical protein